jgi:hypothetical protein
VASVRTALSNRTGTEVPEQALQAAEVSLPLQNAHGAGRRGQCSDKHVYENMSLVYCFPGTRPHGFSSDEGDVQLGHDRLRLKAIGPSMC